MSNPPRPRRRKILIEPGLQLQFALLFVLAGALSLVVLLGVAWYSMDRLADRLPNAAPLLRHHLPDMLWSCGLISFGVITPLAFAVGLRTSFRIAGPIYRFRQFLEAIDRGESTEPCRIRKKDRLHDLCDLLNRVTEERRSHPESGAEEPKPAAPEADRDALPSVMRASDAPETSPADSVPS